MPPKPRTVEVRNLVSVAEILKLAGGVPRSTLALWRRPTTEPPFPRPIKRLKCGELWDAAEVWAWLEQPRYVGADRNPKGLDYHRKLLGIDERTP